VSYLTPASIPAKHRLRLGRIGNPGGYCGVEMLNGRNMPESMRGQFVINDFKSNTVKRFELQPIGSGFKLDWREPVLKSSHRKFRPVDIRMGPDGAIYVADFYNNVICHQDDYFRDPTRDLHHGRIWRVTYKKNPLAPKPAFSKSSAGQLLDMLKASERWTRQQAKFELSKRHGSLVSDIADRWIRRMKTNEPNYSRNLLEALALCATAEATSPQLLERALASGDHRVRAFAARIAGRWHDRLANTHELLELAANDSHPQVRLEAILSCGQVPQASSIHLAAQAVTRHSRDTWIDYAFTQSVRHQEPFWMDGLTEGTLDFADDTDSMLAVFEKGGSGKMLSRLMALAKSEEIKPDGLPGIYKGIASIGGPGELRQIFEPGFHLSAASQEAAWVALAASRRDQKPEGDLQVILRPALEGTNDQLRVQALGLIARWKISELHEASAALAFDDAYSQATRLAAVRTLGELGANETKRLAKLVSGDVPIRLRIAGLESLARLDLLEAAKLGADMVAGSQSINEVLQTFLNRAAGGEALTQALDNIRIGKAAAAAALARLQSIGSSETILMDYLRKVAGVKINVPTYSASYVSGLAKVAAKADAVNGKQIFTTAGCIACHKVGAVKNNGIPFIGPELETIGNTLSTERIIEETIWPGRHVKEGYSLSQLTTKNGDIYQGYEQRSRAKDVIIRPLTQSATITIPHGEIRKQTELGSAMPTGLTANLSKQELADLIRYLAEQGRN